jgi:hypothetical protein
MGSDDGPHFASFRRFFFETMGHKDWRDLVRDYSPILLNGMSSGCTFSSFIKRVLLIVWMFECVDTLVG